MLKGPIAGLLLLPLPGEQQAPLPDKLVAAKSVYVVNESGDLKAFDKFYEALKKWNHFTILTSSEEADVVMVLTTVSNASTVGTVTGGVVSVTAIPALQLKILDRTKTDVLWTDVTDKWINAGHAPSKLVSNLRARLPKR